MWERKCTINKVAERFWDVWHQEYVASKRGQWSNKIETGAVKVKVGDVAGEDNW